MSMLSIIPTAAGRIPGSRDVGRSTGGNRSDMGHEHDGMEGRWDLAKHDEGHTKRYEPNDGWTATLSKRRFPGKYGQVRHGCNFLLFHLLAIYASFSQATRWSPSQHTKHASLAEYNKVHPSNHQRAASIL